MMERLRPRREVMTVGPAGPAIPADDAGNTTDAGGTVTIRHGIHEQRLPVGGMTVAQVRERFADILDIDPRSRAVLQGRDAAESDVVRAGELLQFVRASGEKGSRPEETAP